MASLVVIKDPHRKLSAGISIRRHEDSSAADAHLKAAKKNILEDEQQALYKGCEAYLIPLRGEPDTIPELALPLCYDGHGVLVLSWHYGGRELFAAAADELGRVSRAWKK